MCLEPREKGTGIRNDVEEVDMVKELLPFLPTRSFCFPLLKMQWIRRRARRVYRETIRNMMFLKC